MSYEKRIYQLQAILPEKQLEAILITDCVDLFYLTGVNVSVGSLVITEKTTQLFVDSRYIEKCQETASVPVTLATSTALADYIEGLVSGRFRVGFDSETTTVAALEKLKKALENSSPNLTLVSLPSPTQSIRVLKDKEEVRALRAAAKLGSEGFDFLCTILKDGITEREVAAELEIFWRRNGGEMLAFDPIISFGAHSSMPHYMPGETPLDQNQIILFDIGVVKERYRSDMTRVVAYGEIDEELVKIHQIVCEAQKAALDICQAGTSIAELDRAARGVIEKAGYGKAFTHSLGHGVGLDIHEHPGIRDTPETNKALLEPGMVITIEPGIYVSGLGGVRIEDTVVIEEKGHENLTLRPTDLVSIPIRSCPGVLS